MVGVRGFEPPTPCTPCKCATRLRHTPNGLHYSGGIGLGQVPLFIYTNHRKAGMWGLHRFSFEIMYKHLI